MSLSNTATTTHAHASLFRFFLASVSFLLTQLSIQSRSGVDNAFRLPNEVSPLARVREPEDTSTITEGGKLTEGSVALVSLVKSDLCNKKYGVYAFSSRKESSCSFLLSKGLRCSFLHSRNNVSTQRFQQGSVLLKSRSLNYVELRPPIPATGISSIVPSISLRPSRSRLHDSSRIRIKKFHRLPAPGSR